MITHKNSNRSQKFFPPISLYISPSSTFLKHQPLSFHLMSPTFPPFSLAALYLWNSWLPDICVILSLLLFKKCLKIYIFLKAFPNLQ